MRTHPTRVAEATTPMVSVPSMAQRLEWRLAATLSRAVPQPLLCREMPHRWFPTKGGPSLGIRCGASRP